MVSPNEGETSEAGARESARTNASLALPPPLSSSLNFSFRRASRWLRTKTTAARVSASPRGKVSHFPTLFAFHLTFVSLFPPPLVEKVHWCEIFLAFFCIQNHSISQLAYSLMRLFVSGNRGGVIRNMPQKPNCPDQMLIRKKNKGCGKIKDLVMQL